MGKESISCTFFETNTFLPTRAYDIGPDATGEFTAIVNKQTPSAVVTRTQSMTAMFAEINATLSSATKTTQINAGSTTIRINWPSRTSPGGMTYATPFLTEVVNFQSDSYGDILSGNVEFDGFTGPTSINLYANGPSKSALSQRITLDLTPGNPAILSLPWIPGGRMGWLAKNYIVGTYLIESDDGINVTASPEPPAATPVAEEVSGIKISELNAADSLTDTDLFVLSRDDPAGAPYDESLNVKFSDLVEAVSGTGAQVFAFSSDAITEQQSYTYNYPAGWTGGTPDIVMVSTRYPSDNAASQQWFQTVSWNDSSVIIFAQSQNVNTFTAVYADILLIKNNS